MGSALIVSEQGNGEYVIKVSYNISRALDRLAQLTDEITALYTIMSDLEDKIAALEDERDVLISEMNSSIDEANANLEDNGEFAIEYAKIVASATAKITEINNKLILDSRELSIKKIEQSAKKVEKREIDSALTNYRNPNGVTAWCGDHTEGLTGVVGTVELNDETNAPQDQPIIIKMGGSEGDESVWIEDDGAIQPVVSSGLGAIIYNSIVMPGIQKWAPKYKAGIISDINNGNDTCSVSFSDEQKDSSIKGYETKKRYDIFQSKTIADVPIEYMSCNAAAFEDDDHVIVGFDPSAEDVWASAKVVGFVDNPRPCAGDIFIKHSRGKIYRYRMSGDIELIFDQGNFSFANDYTDEHGTHYNGDLSSGFAITKNPNSSNGYDVYSMNDNTGMIYKNAEEFKQATTSGEFKGNIIGDSTHLFIESNATDWSSLSVLRVDLETKVQDTPVTFAPYFGDLGDISKSEDHIIAGLINNDDSAHFKIFEDWSGSEIADIPTYGSHTFNYVAGYDDLLMYVNGAATADYEIILADSSGTTLATKSITITADEWIGAVALTHSHLAIVITSSTTTYVDMYPFVLTRAEDGSPISAVFDDANYKTMQTLLSDEVSYSSGWMNGVGLFVPPVQ